MTVGAQYLGDGNTPADGRQGYTAETIVSQAHGEYYEMSSRGVLYAACSQAGVAPGTALGSTAFFSLYNPHNSGVDLSLVKVGVSYASGTIGAGSLLHCLNVFGTGAIAQPASGTGLTEYSLKLGDQAKDAAAKGEAGTGHTVTTPVAFMPFCSLTAILASTAVGLYKMEENFNGAVTLRPGNCYQIQGVAAAGSSPLLFVGAMWEEIPIA